MIETINSPKAPSAIGPYVQAKKANGFIFVSGQLGLNPETGKLAEGGIAAQTEQSLNNLKAILEAAGSDMDHVLKTTCLLSDITDFAAFNEVYGKFFKEFPARACFAVKDLPAGGLVEIELVAVEK